MPLLSPNSSFSLPPFLSVPTPPRSLSLVKNPALAYPPPYISVILSVSYSLLIWRPQNYSVRMLSVRMLLLIIKKKCLNQGRHTNTATKTWMAKGNFHLVCEKLLQSSCSVFGVLMNSLHKRSGLHPVSQLLTEYQPSPGADRTLLQCFTRGRRNSGLLRWEPSAVNGSLRAWVLKLRSLQFNAALRPQRP